MCLASEEVPPVPDWVDVVQGFADVQQVLAQNGLEIIANTPPEFATMIKEDARIWNAAAASAGLISQ